MKTQVLVAGSLAAGLLAACSPASPAVPPVSPSATQTPAPISATEFVERVVAGNAAMRTYTIEVTSLIEVSGAQTQTSITGVTDRTDPENVRLDVSTTTAGVTGRMILVEGVGYLQTPELGGKWIHVPPEQAESLRSASVVDNVGGMLRQMQNSIQTIEALGEVDLDGVRTHHYRLIIDGAGYVEAVGSGIAPGMDLQVDVLTYELWLDDSDMIRKTAQSADAIVQGKAMPISVVGTMSQINEPVTIEAPPKNQIVKLPA